MKNVSQESLLYALKYAVKRKSAAPSVVATDIIRNIEALDVSVIDLMIGEIRKAEYHPAFRDMWCSLEKDLFREKELRALFNIESK